jgi:tetrahydromethanopterin S-methyltransferase subunit G
VVQSAIDSGFAVVRLVEADGAATAQPLSSRLAKALRGAEVGSVLFEDHIFGIESRFSLEYSKIEQRVDELQAKVSSGEATELEYRELKKGLDKLEELVAKEDRRRADGSTMAQMVRMQGEFVKALTDELEKSRS